MKIQVTQEDIDNGKPTDCYRCPIARAAQRAFGCHVMVGTGTLTAQKPILRTYRLPKIAINFINDFDFGRPFSPFEFEIQDSEEIPQ